MRKISVIALLPVLALGEVIQGTVVDSLTSQGILRAVVTEKGTSNCDTTDAQGRFSLTLVGVEKGRAMFEGRGYSLFGRQFSWQAQRSETHPENPPARDEKSLYLRNSGSFIVL